MKTKQLRILTQHIVALEIRTKTILNSRFKSSCFIWIAQGKKMESLNPQVLKEDGHGRVATGHVLSIESQ